MSYKVYFAFSMGLRQAIKAPRGTWEKIVSQIKRTEKTLGFKTTQYRDNPKRWESTKPVDGVTDEVFCEIAEEHNRFVRWLYDRIQVWQENPPKDSETITVKQAEKFWHGLSIITVPPERWTRDYYRARMESLYEVMRGNESEGTTFNEKALTPRQAAGVILLFSPYLDKYDLDLEVPKGEDYLASSYDGGYEWCDKCGAVTPEYASACRKRNCPNKDIDDEEA